MTRAAALKASELKPVRLARDRAGAAVIVQPRYVTVDVDQLVIELGVRGSAVHCPLALALRRAGVGTEIHVNQATWHRGLNTALTPLTAKARRWVAAFDAGRQVAPQRFRLPWSRYLVPMTPEWHASRWRP